MCWCWSNLKNFGRRKLFQFANDCSIANNVVLCSLIPLSGANLLFSFFLKKLIFNDQFMHTSVLALHQRSQFYEGVRSCTPSTFQQDFYTHCRHPLATNLILSYLTTVISNDATNMGCQVQNDGASPTSFQLNQVCVFFSLCRCGYLIYGRHLFLHFLF